MEWGDTKAEVIAACDAWLAPHGYKFVKSRNDFHKLSRIECRHVLLTLGVSHHGNRFFGISCGIKNNAINARFHKTSGVPRKYQVHWTVIHLAPERQSWINTPSELKIAIASAKEFVHEKALPLLEKEYSYQDYCDLLNDDPAGPCPYHFNRETRCSYALVAAYLARDPRFESLRNTYASFLRSYAKGFYYPRFERLVADLSGDE